MEIKHDLIYVEKQLGFWPGFPDPNWTTGMVLQNFHKEAERYNPVERRYNGFSHFIFWQ